MHKNQLLSYPFFAYCSNDSARKFEFTVHNTRLGAEIKYGDTSRHYRGTASSDVELTILTKEAFLKMVKETEEGGGSIDWNNQVITN